MLAQLPQIAHDGDRRFRNLRQAIVRIGLGTETGEPLTSGADPLMYYGTTQTLTGWTVDGYMYVVTPGGGGR